MKLSTSSFFVHNSSIKNSAENDVLPRYVFAVLTRKRWAKKKVSKYLTHILYVESRVEKVLSELIAKRRN